MGQSAGLPPFRASLDLSRRVCSPFTRASTTLFRMYLLREREARKTREREEARLAIRQRLRETLQSLCPGQKVYVFGSLARPFQFHHASDVDLALEQLPPGISQYGLSGLLEEELGRPVDLLLLGETRLRHKILSEAEPWMISA